MGATRGTHTLKKSLSPHPITPTPYRAPPAHALPALVWVYSMRFYGPNVILHECTPAVDEEKLNEILTSDGPCMKCVLAPAWVEVVLT